MAIFYKATNTPPKAELIGEWIFHQSWAPSTAGPIELVGSFHLDDPDGQVGIQVFVVRAGDDLYHVPLTYRDTRREGADDSLIGEMEHSVLGTRFVYDGVEDDRYISVCAGVAVHGYGQALGFAQRDGRLYSVPDELLVRGSRSIEGLVAVDGFERLETTPDAAVLRNDRIELTIYRKLTDRPAPPIGLSVSSPALPGWITLVEAREFELSA